jgi:L-amino acid N-acyltransferase YncA
MANSATKSATTTAKAYADRYPRTAELHDLTITLRQMTADDKDKFVAFGNGLSEHDRLFLQRDITQSAIVTKWLAEMDDRGIVAIMALADDTMVGYGMVVPSTEIWSKHVAEIRIAVAPQARGKGLGRFLAQEAFAVALACDVEKMMARMTPDQKGAVAAFEGLGFRAEGLLRDHMIDQDGNRHDLLIMGHDVQRFQSTMQSYGMDEALA